MNGEIKYEKIAFEVILFHADDVILTSGGSGGKDPWELEED